MSLFVVDRGFRLPRKRTELEENMLYVERQLEQYLHEHEVAAGGGVEDTISLTTAASVEYPGALYQQQGATSNRMLGQEIAFPGDVAVSSFQAQIGHHGEPLVSSEDGHTELIWVEIYDAVGGSKVATSSTTSTDSLERMEVFDHAGAVTPITFTFSPSVSVTDKAFFVLRREFETSSSAINRCPTWRAYTNNGPLTLYAGGEAWAGNNDNASWVKMSDPFHWGGTDGINDVDFDFVVTFEAADGSTLSVTPVGFRFPRRDFNNESAKMENARYLQTQLELYLHEHVETEEEEGGAHR